MPKTWPSRAGKTMQPFWPTAPCSSPADLRSEEAARTILIIPPVNIALAEIWDPATQDVKPVAPASSVYRGYHSTALLLPDGRVLVAGGNHDQPLPAGGSEYVEQKTAEIYSPPYLFSLSPTARRQSGRPSPHAQRRRTGRHGFRPDARRSQYQQSPVDCTRGGDSRRELEST